MVRGQRSSAALRGDGRQGRQARAQGTEALAWSCTRACEAPISRARALHVEEIDHAAQLYRSALLLMAGSAAAVLAHHGWGSYDASKPITVAGTDRDLEVREPARTHHRQGADKVWTVTLAPVSRMQSRGAPAELVAVGKTVSAYGYPSTVENDEMRAERITVDGKTGRAAMMLARGAADPHRARAVGAGARRSANRRGLTRPPTSATSWR